MTMEHYNNYTCYVLLALMMLQIPHPLCDSLVLITNILWDKHSTYMVSLMVH